MALGNSTLLLEPTVMVPLVRNFTPVKVRLLGLRSAQLMNTLAWETVSGEFMEQEAPAKSSGKTTYPALRRVAGLATIANRALEDERRASMPALVRVLL